MKSLKTLTRQGASFIIASLSASAFAHNGEHAETTTLLSVANHITHLLSEAGHIGSIALIALAGLALTKALQKKNLSQATHKKQPSKIYASARCDR